MSTRPTSPRSATGLSPLTFDLVSHWRLAAPVAPVWAVLTRTQDWPLWWPYVRHVQLLRDGSAGPGNAVGSVRRIEWATRLPYRIVIDVETVESVPLNRLRCRASGHLSGEGIWLLREDAGQTDVTYLWRVELTQPWMRFMAPVLAPVFRWNHNGVMQAGGAGLAHHLGVALVSARGV